MCTRFTAVVLIVFTFHPVGSLYNSKVLVLLMVLHGVRGKFVVRTFGQKESKTKYGSGAGSFFARF